MYWLIIFLMIILGGFVGFLLGVAYGQEHKNDE